MSKRKKPTKKRTTFTIGHDGILFGSNFTETDSLVLWGICVKYILHRSLWDIKTTPGGPLGPRNEEILFPDHYKTIEFSFENIRKAQMQSRTGDACLLAREFVRFQFGLLKIVKETAKTRRIRRRRMNRMYRKFEKFLFMKWGWKPRQHPEPRIFAHSCGKMFL
jgi:hypothetical protein